MSLREGRRELGLGGPPLLMGIVNASPDSFSDAGDHPDLLAHAARLVADPGFTELFSRPDGHESSRPAVFP